MKPTKTQANYKKSKQTMLRQYRYFSQLIILLLSLLFIEKAFCIDVENIDEFGFSKSEPINSGFFFHEGKYIDAPYNVERRGLDVYINDILVHPSPLNNQIQYKENQPKKEDFIRKMEGVKKYFETLLQNNMTLFKKGGVSIIISNLRALNTIEVLLSDANDSDKFKALNEEGHIMHCEEVPWIVTDFKGSPQLNKRFNLLKQQAQIMPIINESRSRLNSRRGASPLDELYLESLENTDSTQVAANISQIPIAEMNDVLKVSPNKALVSTSKQTRLAQIEDSSHHSIVLIIGLLFLCIGMLSIVKFYHRKNMKKGGILMK